MSAKQQDQLTLRWASDRDVHAILAIEQASFSEPWRAKDFCEVLKAKDANIALVEQRNRVVAFAVYENQRTTLNLLNFAVAPDARGQGVASFLIGYLIAHLTRRGRRAIECVVSDRNLPTLQFLRKRGFLCVSVLRGHYGPGHDGYLMEFCTTEPGGRQ